MAEKTYTAANGTTFTDDDIERWAAADEAGVAWTGGHVGPVVMGRPITVGERARPFTLRLDAQRRAKLDAEAAHRHTTISQVMRDLIDSL
jgi:hypothetical protein